MLILNHDLLLDKNKRSFHDRTNTICYHKIKQDLTVREIIIRDTDDDLDDIADKVNIVMIV